MTQKPISISSKPPPSSDWSIKISLTDRCNFRCYYCIQLPQIVAPSRNEITVARVRDALSAARQNGIASVLWTGGEPTLGPLTECSLIAKQMGFQEQGITSNGFLLNRLLDQLFASGLTRANISLDTLRADRFKAITGSTRLEEVLSSIRRCSAELKTTKVNVVVMRTNIDEIPDFVNFARTVGNNLIVKFHEMWKIAPEEKWAQLHVPAEEIFRAIQITDSIDQVAVVKTNPGVDYYKLVHSSVTVGLARMPRSHICEVKECKKVRIYPNGKTCEGADLIRHPDWRNEFAALMLNRENALVENSAAMRDRSPSQNCSMHNDSDP